MNSVDYVKAKLNKRKEPTFYELIERSIKDIDLTEKYSKGAIYRKVKQAVKAGYLTDEGWGVYRLTDKAKEFFTRKHV
jgi:DNA-binding PadR family transcriptional regulator